MSLLDSDEDLSPLRGEGARWKAAVEAADRNAHPCLYDVRYRQLDFWVGVWDVRPNGAPQSQAPSSNVITKEHDGCVIHESWTAPASNGQSVNIYDISRDHWYQTWVDNSGGLHEYKGGLEGANMVYFADLAPSPGQTDRVPTRLTFFNQGKDQVRQLGEQQNELGRMQHELGGHQNELGGKQNELGDLQNELGRRMQKASEEAERAMGQLLDEAIRSGQATRVD